jgi:(E)-4-hydroxy-3-methylbut-2-enyl-diphosphate synthase
VVKPVKVAVMGCYVNGPGEAAESDIGVVASGTTARVFLHGKVIKTLVPFDLVTSCVTELIRTLQ